jgi:hypothetical protein
VDPGQGVGFRGGPVNCITGTLMGRILFLGLPTSPFIRRQLDALCQLRSLCGLPPFMCAAVIPSAWIVQHDKSLFLQFGKSALGGAFGDAQCLDRFIHGKPYVAVVAAIVARMKLKPDFHSGPGKGPPGR